jgi:hypothetical protein
MARGSYLVGLEFDFRSAGQTSWLTSLVVFLNTLDFTTHVRHDSTLTIPPTSAPDKASRLDITYRADIIVKGIKNYHQDIVCVPKMYRR